MTEVTEEIRIEKLEKYVKESTKKMDEIMKQIANLEKENSELTQFKTEMLNKLQHLKKTMTTEAKEADFMIGNVEELKVTNAKLTNEVEKQKYRIQILLSSLEDAEKIKL
jgi:chromosome segregation ATPase